jgi:lipopolysaccharide assembly outer membrane protein LptD (OstA)
MRKAGIITVFIILMITVPVFSQSGEAIEAETAISSKEDAPEGLPDYIEMDIQTSRLDELADWCRRLGLSDAGDRNELSDRLRKHYGIATSRSGSETKNNRSITIESARSTDYFTLEKVNESYARLSGAVVITVKDDESIHRLKAEEVLFNRTRNTLNARGHVEYTKESGGIKETFKGDSITLSLDTWEGVFLGGASERSLSDNSTTYRFAGEIISRDEEEVTVLQHAKITNASQEEDYWSVAATKLWLLPSSDWAMANAVLKVGEIPLLYIPFLYLPGDELIFHPVLGYRSREGTFVQTTTYILGQPKASTSSENSITQILGSSTDTERKREGLFLRSTGKRLINTNSPSLSLLFDVYANLGAYAGINASIPKNGIFGKTDISFGLGLTRDIYEPQTNYYTPFENNDGESNWNTAELFGNTIPFRYRFKGTGSITTSRFSLTWEFPLYSDPYVDRDFLNRTENISWFQMIKESLTRNESTSTTTTSTIGSYLWNVKASFPGPLYSSNAQRATLSVQHLSSSLYFNTRSVSNPESPLEALFFYPDHWTIYTTSLSLKGVLWGTTDTKEGLDASKGKAEQSPTALQIPDSWSPWYSEELQNPTEQKLQNETNKDPLATIQPPSIQQSFEVSNNQSVKLNIDYSYNPSFSTELFFRSSEQHWKTQNDVRWDDYSSIFTNYKSDANLGISLSDPLGFVSTSLKLTDQTSFQIYNYMNGEAEDYDTESEKQEALLETYTGTYNYVIPEYSFKLSPFVQNDVWKDTSLQYNLRGTLLKTSYDGDVDTGSWITKLGTWNKNYVSKNQIKMNLVALTGNQSQSSTLSLDLPPQDSLLSSATNLNIGISQTSVSFSILNPFEAAVYKPVTASEELKLQSNISLTQSLIYDPELKDITYWSSGSIVGPMSASYIAKRDASTGELEPTTFSLVYKDSFKNDTIWKNRVAYSFDINSSLNMDLQSYNNSVFTFSLGTTWKIAQFLDISFSSKSQNSVVFRYVQDWPIWESHTDMPGEENPLIDLLNSFRFDNNELRKQSGFKLKSLSVKAIHYLGDWNATLEVNLSPYLNTAVVPMRYQFNTTVSFLVQWIPIPEFKTETYRDSKNGFIFK